MLNWSYLFDHQRRDRGRECYLAGAVTELRYTYDSVCEAIVVGMELYHVRVRLCAGEITEMHCSCPDAEKGSNCKHEAALLYALEAWAKDVVDDNDASLARRIDTLSSDEIEQFLQMAIDNQSMRCTALMLNSKGTASAGEEDLFSLDDFTLDDISADTVGTVQSEVQGDNDIMKLLGGQDRIDKIIQQGRRQEFAKNEKNGARIQKNKASVPESSCPVEKKSFDLSTITGTPAPESPRSTEKNDLDLDAFIGASASCGEFLSPDLSGLIGVSESSRPTTRERYREYLRGLGKRVDEVSFMEMAVDTAENFASMRCGSEYKLYGTENPETADKTIRRLSQEATFVKLDSGNQGKYTQAVKLYIEMLCKNRNG